MMKRMLFALLMASIAGLWAGPASAVQCVCAKVVMYPVPGGWLHYAQVCNTGPSGCIPVQYTGYIDTMALPPQSCNQPYQCSGCSTFGSPTTLLPAYDLYFQPTGGTLPGLAALDTDKKVQNYLKDHQPLDDLGDVDTTDPDTAMEYDNYNFFIPYGGSEPLVLELIRKVGNVEQKFYAVVWKMQSNDATVRHFAYVGFEITKPAGDVTPIPASRIWNAMVTNPDPAMTGKLVRVPTNGLLQVKIKEGPNNTIDADDEFAFIRLQDSPENKTAVRNDYPQLYADEAIEGEGVGLRTSDDRFVAPSYRYVNDSACRQSCWYCRQRHGCRGRRCR